MNVKNTEGRINKWIEIISVKGAMVLGMFILGTFSVWALLYKHEIPMDLSAEKVRCYEDNYILNVVTLLLTFVLMWLVKRIVLRGDAIQQRKRSRFFAAVLVGVIGALMVIWVSITHVEPVWDQLQVLQGAEAFRAGNFELMDTYYDMCPYQYGLTLWYELWIPLSEGYVIHRYLNVALIMLTLYFIYLLTDEMFQIPEVSLYALMGSAMFLPFPLYVNFIYGDLWHMSLGVIAIWAMLRFLHKGGLRYAVLSVSLLSVAMAFRNNIIIWLIAMAIILVLYGLCHRDGRVLAVAILVIALPLSAVELIQVSYEYRSGKEISAGAPNLANIAMGLQESWQGPGYYNAYNVTVYVNDANRDEVVAKEIAKQDIRETIQEFSREPAVAVDFFKRKLQNQWNEGTFNSLIMTATFTEEPKGIVQSVYYGTIEHLIYLWSNYYLFVVYFGAFIYAVVGVIKEKRIENCILVVALIGGVILSALWEAKARYMLPYTALLFPCMAMGIYWCKKGCLDRIRQVIIKGKSR